MHYKPLPTRGPNPPAYTSPGVSSSTLGGVLFKGGKEMEDYQRRVLEEKAELDDRRDKLQAFCGTGRFAELDPPLQDCMREQFRVMGRYSDILGTRIRGFTPERSKEMANILFDSAKLNETMPKQEMAYNKEEERVYCSATCPYCAQVVLVPFQRIVKCPDCGNFFKVSMA